MVKLVEFNCPVCESNNYTKLYASNLRRDQYFSEDFSCTSLAHNEHFQIVRCSECEMVFSNPRPSERELANLYGGVTDNLYEEQEEGRRKTFANAFRKVRKNGGNLLDIGCNTGACLEIARDRGFNSFGIEPSKYACVKAVAKGFPVVCNIAPCELPWNIKFDIITMWDVLEHVDNPKELLLYVKSLLSKNGELHFSTLRIDSWFPKLLKDKWPWYMKMHLHYFSSKTICRLLSSCGFSDVCIYRYSHIVRLDYLKKKINAQHGLIKIPANAVIKLLGDDSRYIKVSFGDIMHVIARA